MSGSVSIDGSSGMRRTCNLSLIAQNVNINEFYWTMRTKFKLQIGLKNFINIKYDDIIWFPLGTYYITNFSQSFSMNNYNINISGQDKMCMLNGSMGGTIMASHDFGTINETRRDSSGEKITVTEKIPIYEIIRNAVHQYGNEPYENIIISDLDDVAVELLDYKIKTEPLYVFRQWLNTEKTQYIMNIAFASMGGVGAAIEKEIKGGKVDKFEFTFKDKEYQMEKVVTFNETAGYRKTDLTYAGDLILGVGSTITNLLDTIISMLGNYEYFYDLEGRFIFQRKRTTQTVTQTEFLSRVGNPMVTQPYTSLNTFNFNQGFLINSFNNNPNIMNICNDYAIWGTLNTVTTEDMPIHLRYAIDDKPTEYKSKVYDKTFYSFDAIEKDDDGISVDWRELLYLMAYDQSQSKTDYLDTKYNAYYTDMLEFWRRIYNPIKLYIDKGLIDETDLEEDEIIDWSSNDYWNPDIFIITEGNLIIKEPKMLYFWIDFLDNDSFVSRYKVSAIGRRAKAINDTDVKCIFNEETPGILFVSSGDVVEDTNEPYDGVSYFKVNIPTGFENYFAISTQGKSAWEELQNLLYQHTCFQETITIQAVPIYTLEPNTRITISDDKSGINGEYLVRTISLPLTYDGIMSINASKAEEAIL